MRELDEDQGDEDRARVEITARIRFVQFGPAQRRENPVEQREREHRGEARRDMSANRDDDDHSHHQDRKQDMATVHVLSEQRARGRGAGPFGVPRDQVNVRSLRLRRAVLQIPHPVQDQRSERDPELAPGAAPPEQFECDRPDEGKSHSRTRHCGAERDRGTDVTEPVVPIEQEQCGETTGDRADVLDLEGPEQVAPGAAEEQDHDRDGQREPDGRASSRIHKQQERTSQGAARSRTRGCGV